jgi:hypothetical protein
VVLTQTDAPLSAQEIMHFIASKVPKNQSWYKKWEIHPLSFWSIQMEKYVKNKMQGDRY